MTRLQEYQSTTKTSDINLPYETVFELLKLSYLEVVASNFCNAVLSENLEKQLHAVTSWLSNPGKQRWLVLCGILGNGKTTMVKAIQRFFNKIRIQVPYEKDYLGVVIKSASLIASLNGVSDSEFQRLVRIPILAIDDVGKEPNLVQTYGNYFAPIEELLSARYENRNLTIISSNLNPDQMKKYYGMRLEDRLKEMVYKVCFDNNSYRR